MKLHAQHSGWLLSLLIGLLAGSWTFAQTPPGDAERAKLQEIQAQRAAQQNKYQTLKGQEQNLLGELNTIDQQLKNSQQKLEGLRAKLETNEAERQRIQANLKKLETAAQQTNTALAKRLRAIYKMGDLGYLTPLFAVSAQTAAQQDLRYLQRLAAHDVQLLQQAQSHRQAVLKEQAALEKRQQDILQAQQEIQQQSQAILAQKDQKTNILNRIQNDGQQFAKVLAELDALAQKLDRFLSDIETTPPATQVPARAIPAEVVIPANAQEVVLSYGNNFRANKGKFLWPVQGKILTPFGNIQIGDTFTHYKGVDIQAKNGTPFYAVFKGTVKYAGWFDGYGNMIIVDHGGNFYTLYAHADEVSVKTGEPVETRQVLGKVGDTDSIKGALLYFEIRANGKPENPQTWLAAVR